MLVSTIYIFLCKDPILIPFYCELHFQRIEKKKIKPFHIILINQITEWKIYGNSWTVQIIGFDRNSFFLIIHKSSSVNKQLGYTNIMMLTCW